MWGNNADVRDLSGLKRWWVDVNDMMIVGCTIVMFGKAEELGVWIWI